MNKSDIAMRWFIDKIRQGDYAIREGKVISYTNKGLGKQIGTLSRNGYLTLRGYCNGKRARFTVHRMIWVYHHGDIPNGMTINHINGLKTDNRIENLELMTVSENTSHSHKIGLTDKKGTNHHNSKLLESQVRDIRNKLSNGVSIKELSKEYGVHIQTLYSIRNGTRWTHL